MSGSGFGRSRVAIGEGVAAGLICRETQPGYIVFPGAGNGVGIRTARARLAGALYPWFPAGGGGA